MTDLITYVPEAELTHESPSIADLVVAAALARPEAAALVATADRIPVSYGELIGLVDDLAGQLQDAGLRPGDRLALRSGSNAEFVVGLLAASRAGLIAVPLDPALPVGDQRARSEVAGAGVVLVDGAGPGDEQEPGLVRWTFTVTVGRAGAPSSVDLAAAAAPNRDVATPDGLHDDDAMIMFTGGTTAMPKMVPWTRANIASSVRAIVAAYQLGPDDATVAVMPLYHGHGLIAALL
ncbi:AMP-binding protein, partial [Mycobacterium montefiorense]